MAIKDRMFNPHYAPSFDYDTAAAAVSADMVAHPEKAAYTFTEIRNLAGIPPQEFVSEVHMQELARRIGTRLIGEPE